MATPDSFDVVIGGGGLAGLSLARHLRRRLPEVSVLVVDRAERPLPEAAFKVGESSVAVGGYYFQEVLGLREYLERRHLLKLGLRYFFRDRGGSFADRPELGASVYRTSQLGDFPITEWQLDRGRLENDLREMNQEAGVELAEGWRVDDLEVGDPTHRVQLSRGDQRREVRGRWFIDAMSRRFFLRRRFGLEKKVEPAHSAVWFRVAGRVDLTDWVPRERRAWHDRVPGRHPTDPTYGRYNSTNHLLGPGYWAWLIPLGSGTTSVGIVAREDMQPLAEMRSYDDALGWLRENEPTLAAALAGREILDFKRLRNYSHSSARVISAERWAMTGEAGCFIDPLYSPGSDAIAYMNSIICESIRLEREGRLTAELAESLSRDYIGWSELSTRSIQAGYPLFGHTVVGSIKLMWDFAVGLVVAQPPFFDLRLRPGFVTERAAWPADRLERLREQVGGLTGAVARLLHAWMPRAGADKTFDFIESLDQNPVSWGQLQVDEAAGGHPLDRWFAGLERLRGFAAALFLFAVEDVHPGRLPELLDAPRIEPSAMQLDPAGWDRERLFAAGGVPREKVLTYLGRLRSCYRPVQPGDAA